MYAAMHVLDHLLFIFSCTLLSEMFKKRFVSQLSSLRSFQVFSYPVNLSLHAKGQGELETTL